MKYIKKFEGRKAKSTTQKSDEEIMLSYKDKCDDLDYMSHITFDEFFNSLDFNIFSKCDHNKFHGSGVGAGRIRKNTSSRWGSYGDFSYETKHGKIHFYSSSYGPICPNGLENSLEWKKRNVFFYAEVNTGGASGGSCWDEADDPGAQPYDGKSLDLNDFIFSYLMPTFDDILSSHANEKTSKQLCQILYSNPYIIKEDSRSETEYYGNYDDYSCYYITLGNLYQFLSENNSF